MQEGRRMRVWVILVVLIASSSPRATEGNCSSLPRRLAFRAIEALPLWFRAPILLKAAQAAEWQRSQKGHPASEHLALQTLRNFLPDDPVIIQGGAYIGYMSLEMSSLWPKGQIHAFEAAKDLSVLASLNTRHRPNIHIHSKAISSKSGSLPFYRSSGSGLGSSSLMIPLRHREVYPDIHFDRTEFVDSIALTDFVLSKKIPRIDLLWLDLQGGELEALRGAAELLPYIPFIFIEVNLEEMYKGAPLYAELRAWLEHQGYQVANEFFSSKGSQGDVLFMKK